MILPPSSKPKTVPQNSAPRPAPTAASEEAKQLLLEQLKKAHEAKKPKADLATDEPADDPAESSQEE